VLRKIGVVVAWLIGALVILVAVLWFRPTWTPSIREQGQTVKGSIASLETVDLNGVEQDVLIRGRDARNPILLFLHGGPGMPAMYLAHSFQRDLEQDFVVVQWDRRGAGRTFCRDRNVPMSVSQEVEDTHALIEWLRERFHQPKIFLVGHSYGSYLGMLVAQRYPQLLYAYVGVGQLAYEGVPNQQLQDQFIERMARQSEDEHVLTEIKTGHFDREALLFRYGAEVHKYRSWWPLLGIGLLAPEYNLRYAMCVPAGV
jgi:pimeloyl-ACP methyl ester carboxylesterase